MPLPPYPNQPALGTWSPGEQLWTANLNADPGNTLLLLANRPVLAASQLTTGQSMGTSDTGIQLDTEFLDAWSGHTPGSSQYQVPFWGWYLSELTAEYSTLAATTAAVAGIQTVSSGLAANRDGGKACGNGSGAIGVTAAELSLCNPAFNDYLEPYGSATVATDLTTGAASGARFKTEWVGVQDGTVVTSPQPAALWPPGAGTTITNSGGIPAGATSMTVASATGMITGGSLGLDYLNGAQTSAGAETVTITSVTGLTIGISATSYPHNQNAPVAVPVSGAWMNQQVRDISNFLLYPPMANLNTSGTSATLGSGTAAPVTFTTAVVDSFSGWNSATEYVFPVSGVYYCFGQVYLTTHASYQLGAALSVSGGTPMYGTVQRNQSSTSNYMCATVRRHLRVTAGQNVQLYGYQNSGSALALMGSGNAYCKLIVVWRGF